MIKYKCNLLELLKARGYNQTKLQREKLLPNQTLQNIRQGKMISLDTLNKICIMCRCQPGDLIECIPTDDEKIKYF